MSYTQNARVTINKRKATLKEVLNEIEKQTDYLFIYNNEVNTNEKVSVRSKQKAVSEVLNSLLEEKDMSYSMEGNHILLSVDEKENINTEEITSIVIQQQKKQITGKVVDESGEAIIGANIIEQGTTNGTITDIDGNFILSIEENAIIHISYIGYLEQEISTSNRSTLEIILLEDTQSLDELVVIGYGTARKSDITGAMSRANLTSLENSPNVNLAEMLKGIVPGLNIGVIRSAGGNPDISIRGRNSISGSQSPLIVLDGIIFRGEFADINPDDIETVDVLRDASSTAIYGSQGANGVILISTKTAKKILKPTIEYSANFSLQRLIKALEPLDSEGYIRQLEDAFISESRMGEDLMQRNTDFKVETKFKDPVVTDGYLMSPMTNTNWWDLLSNSFPYIQTHNISIRGKSEASSYFLSYGFTDQKNIVKNDNFERHNIRLNLESIITNWLKIGTQSYFNLSNFSGNAPAFGDLLQIPALVTPYNEDGTIKTQHYLGGINPLLSTENPDLDTRTSISGSFYGEITIPWIKGLSYRSNYSNVWTTSRNYTFDPYANSLSGGARKYHTNRMDMTFDNIVTYKHDFDKHSVNATFVYGVEKREYDNTDARANRFVDQTLIYNNLQAGQADQRDVRSDAWKETSLYSMARLVYTYNNRYSFTGTVRRDGFSGFGVNNKFAVFPSAAIAWRLSEESFIKGEYAWIDDFKLRLSYGEGGNRTIGRYETMARMATGVGYVFGEGGTGEISQYVNRLENRNLKWETTTSTNIGLDFSFFRGRLSGSYDFYSSITKDLLYNINVPRINGVGVISIPTNIGKLKNSGHELSISGIPVKTKDFEWDVTLNFSRNKNKVISILGPGPDGKESDLIASNIFIGKSLDPIYDYKIIGMWQVSDFNEGLIPNGFTYGTYKLKTKDSNGIPNPNDDREILGYRDPLYRFSIVNAFKFKNFEVRAMINSIQGGKNHYLGRPARRLPIRDHLQNWAYMKFDYWTPENPNAKYRQLGEYNTITGAEFSPYVSRSFVRLQELSLSYNFPQSVLNETFLSRAKVFITGTNLLTISNWDGWDPEADQGLGYNFASFGDNYGGGPMMKSYSIGLNIEF
ncbi:MAG: TonB-dependent receptor [Fermentimonas sp.]|nr:TonB-dependent receptor [Fermentimonas sp.]